MTNALKYVTGAAQSFLINQLNLSDKWDQDWEYIVADESRIEEFLEFYTRHSLSIEQRFALMIIIIGSFDDYITAHGFSSAIWSRIKLLLEQHKQIHLNTIIYWSSEQDDIEDGFAVTRYMREIEV